MSSVLPSESPVSTPITTNRPLALTFGMLAPSLRSQLQEQGFTIALASIVDYQKDADAIQRLRERGLIPPSVVEREEKRIVYAITKDVQEKEKKGRVTPR